MKHRTKIIEKRIHSSQWIFSFACNSCSFPQDYHREWYHDLEGRKLAVEHPLTPNPPGGLYGVEVMAEPCEVGGVEAVVMVTK